MTLELIGAGGLGSPTLMYLAAAGVGRIGIVDDDVVDESNLQRQVVHATDAVGTPKGESARQRLAAADWVYLGTHWEDHWVRRGVALLCRRRLFRSCCAA